MYVDVYGTARLRSCARACVARQTETETDGRQRQGQRQRQRQRQRNSQKDANRLESSLTAAKQPWQHLACYSLVDIALDTFPYSGTTTTVDALLMGVPVVRP